MSDEEFECQKCHALVQLGDGLIPTKYCNLCAQELVESMSDRMQAVEKERDRLRTHVIEFLNDWKKGDFQLSELAACDARAMEEALQPAQKDPQ